MTSSSATWPGAPRERDLALLHQEELVGDLQRHVRVLLDHEDGDAVAVQLLDDVEDPLDDQRRQAHRRFIHHQELGPAHQCARHRQHLLLAARQRAGGLGPAFFQGGEPREQRLEVAGDRGMVAAQIGAGSQVFGHRHLRKHQPVLRHQGDAAADDAIGRLADQLVAVEAHRAAPRPQDAGDGVHQRRLAGAVGPEQAGDAAGIDRQRHALQRLDLAVGGDDVVHLEHRHVAVPR